MKKIILIVLGILVFSCATDDFEKLENNNQEESFINLDVKLEKVDLNFISTNNNKTYKKFTEINHEINKYKIANRGDFHNLTEFIELDTTNIIQAEYYGKKSYTFKIIEKNNFLYNIVLAEVSSEDYELMLARYPKSPDYSADNYQFVMIKEDDLVLFLNNLDDIFTQNFSSPDTDITGEQICPEGFCCSTEEVISPATGWSVQLITGVFLCNDDDWMEIDPNGGGGFSGGNGDSSGENGSDSGSSNGSDGFTTPPTGGGSSSGGTNSNGNAYDYGNNNTSPVDNDGGDSFDPDQDTNRIKVITLPNLGDNSAFLEFYNTLSVPQLILWNSLNSQQKDAIKEFLFKNNYSLNAQDFALELMEIMEGNPEITWSNIENWFLGEDPGSDLSEIINPDNITYDAPLTQQDLPSMSDFVNYFPKKGTSGNYTEMPTSEVYELVGGTLWNSHQNDVNNNYQNACSIRGSRGLLYSGIVIPVLHYNTQRTQKGGDNKNYILDAVSFDKFMRDKFGSPTHELTGTDANDLGVVVDFLKDKNGIYVIINSDGRSRQLGGAGYSGHVDAIINGMCISSAYTTPQGGVKSIAIWELD